MRRRYIGNDMTRASARQAVRSTGVGTPTPKPRHQGNLAGLKDQKSVYLQHNQGGYFNPAVQKARYSSKGLDSPTINPYRNPMSTNSGRMLDTRVVKSDMTSFSKLLKLIK